AMIIELVSRVAFVVGGLEASGSGSQLADPVGTHSRAGILSREAPWIARHFARAKGRRRSGSRAPRSIRARDHGARLPDRGRFETSERPATLETSSWELRGNGLAHERAGAGAADAAEQRLLCEPVHERAQPRGAGPVVGAAAGAHVGRDLLDPGAVALLDVRPQGGLVQRGAQHLGPDAPVLL